MIIKSTSQIFTKSFDPNEAYDLILVSSGYEDRCTFLVKELEPIATSKFVLAFPNPAISTAMKKNDNLFEKKGYLSIKSDGDDEKHITSLLTSLSQELKDKSRIKILVDYSSMTRVWYACILKYFWLKRQPFTSVTLDFFYSYASYSPNKALEKKNIHINPIESFTNFSLPSKETALIIGLGYEKNKAYGLTEYFDATTFYFITDQSKGASYSDEVLTINKALLKTVTPDKIFLYPINDLKYTEDLLCSLCESLSLNYKIIIAPCGPKPFTLISLIAAMRTNLVDVWRISPGKGGDPINRKPDGTYSLYRINLFDDGEF
jgi:hypothetical protein